MKKLMFILLFLAGLSTVMAQNYMTISGNITDVATGAPVVNHAVTIQTDSTNPSGFYYYNVVYTFSNGFYVDTIGFNTGVIPSGILMVSTLDCQQYLQMATFNFGPGNQSFVKDFQICTSPSPCNADFTWQISPNSLTVQFIDQSTGGINLSRFWNFGDGVTSDLINPSHTYLQPGYYDVTLSVYDSIVSGCYDTETKTIHVGDSTGGGCVADFYNVPDSSNPMNIMFFDQSVGNNITSWFWSFGDGASSGQQNPVHLYVQPGSYTVCLTIQSNDSACYNTNCKEVTVGNTTGCQAQFTWYSDSTNTLTTVYFIDLSIGGGSTWFWDFGDSTYSTSQNPEHTYAQPGTYYICLSISGQNPACQSTWCTNVTVGNNTGCASYFTFSQNGLNVAFEGYMLNGLPATYSWAFGDGTGGSGQNVTHTYGTPGMYFVSLTTTSNNCTYSSGQTIQVGDSGQFNQVYGQVYEGNFVLNSGIAMIFSVDSLNTMPYYDISLIDSMGIYSFPYVPQGNFVVWIIPTDGSTYLPTYYGDVLFWQDATIISLGQPVNPYNIYLIPANDAPGGPGEISGHINSMIKNGLDDKIRMILQNEEGKSIGFANVSSTGDFGFNMLSFGVYFLRAELPGTTSDLIRIEITHENPNVDVVLTYSGNHLLGLNDPVSPVETLLLFPNPFNEVINLKAAVKKDVAVNVILSDMAGHNVMSWLANLMIGTNNFTINTLTLQPGIYFLRITAQDGTAVIRKLVKTK